MKRRFRLRTLAWIFATLVTLYCLFVAIENWTGARALAAAKEQVAKEGESLDFMSLIPPLPPEAENFCALEPLAGLSNPKNKPASALEALEKLTSKAPGGLNSIQVGTAPDLKPWIEHLAKNGIGTEGATPVDMLAALDAAQQKSFEADIVALLERMNVGGSGSLVVPSEYLEVVITKH